MRFLRHFSIAILAAAMNLPVAGALYLASPARSEDAIARPLLVVSGKIAEKNGKTEVSFTRSELEAFGLETVETTAPWYTGKVKFEGISLTKLMQKLGASGKTAVATALDDYVSTIPVEDFTKYHVILAMRRDGKDMAINDKGPLFIVYPYDSKAELQTQMYYSRSAWQVKRIDIK